MLKKTPRTVACSFFFSPVDEPLGSMFQFLAGHQKSKDDFEKLAIPLVRFAAKFIEQDTFCAGGVLISLSIFTTDTPL